MKSNKNLNEKISEIEQKMNIKLPEDQYEENKYYSGSRGTSKRDITYLEHGNYQIAAIIVQQEIRHPRDHNLYRRDYKEFIQLAYINKTDNKHTSYATSNLILVDSTLSGYEKWRLVKPGLDESAKLKDCYVKIEPITEDEIRVGWADENDNMILAYSFKLH